MQEMTAAAFFTHGGLRACHSGDLAVWTEDGEIRIFGRLDNQIKLRDFRIEPDGYGESAATLYPLIGSTPSSSISGCVKSFL